MMRDQFRRFADDKVAPYAHGWHLRDELIPLRGRRADGRARRLRPDHPGGVRRARHGQDGDVRRHRGAVARLYRRRLARHALGDRGRADPRSAAPTAQKEKYLPQHRLGRDPADGGVHRAQHRLRPRLAAHPRRARRRHLQGHRQQDLDHPRRARRPDDAAGAHRSRRAGLSRPVDVPGREAARHRRRSVPRRGHERRRDRGARLSRHEGIRARLRRLRGAGRQPARRRGGPGLQAAHGDLRERPHPDRGARRRRGAERARARPALRQGAHPVRQAAASPSRASPASSPGWRSRP